MNVLLIFAGIFVVIFGIIIRLLKLGLKTSLSLIGGAFFSISAGLFFSCQPPEVITRVSYLEINGVYGIKLNYREIMGITLSNTIPPVITTTNGFAIGSVLRGNFKLQGIGTAKLFVKRDAAPFICIATKKSYLILNTQEKEKTIKTFNLIRKAWKKRVK
jgi:hypothetical protein